MRERGVYINVLWHQTRDLVVKYVSSVVGAQGFVQHLAVYSILDSDILHY